MKQQYHLLIAVYLFFSLCSSVFAQQSQSSVFKNESELGIVSTWGNARSQTVNAKQLNSYEFGFNLFRLSGAFLRSSAQGNESARSWNAGLRFERSLTTRFSAFIGQNVEGDKYAGFEDRYNTDVGGKYFFLKHDDLYWTGEAGYRFTSENKTNAGIVNSQRLRLYSELEKKWTEALSGRLAVECIPNLSLSKDWLLNGEASIATALTTVFSLKIGYSFHYDHFPEASLKNYDSIFTTALVAKF